MSNFSKIALRSTLAAMPLALVLMAPAARAADFIPGGEEQFKLTAGGVLASFDSNVSLNGTTDDGVPIDLGGDGRSKRANNFVLGAQWRFLGRSRLTGLYFTTKKERSVTYNNSITVDDTTYDPPITLDATTRNTFIFATYEYSFVKKDNIEIAGLIGLYLNKFKVDVSGTAQGENGPVSGAINYNPSATVPMPLIGASLDWYITPQFSVQGSLSGLKAKIGNIDGSVYVATVGAEYMFTRNLGLGLSFMHTRANVDVTKDNFDGSIDWTNNNFLFYAVAKF
jgi:hypothetical protein